MSCNLCRLEPFPRANTALSAVMLNGKKLFPNKNVSNLWEGSRANDPFPAARYVAFDVPIPVLVDGLNTISLSVNRTLRGVQQCIACGSEFPVITHVDLQLPVRR